MSAKSERVMKRQSGDYKAPITSEPDRKAAIPKWDPENAK